MRHEAYLIVSRSIKSNLGATDCERHLKPETLEMEGEVEIAMP